MCNQFTLHHQFRIDTGRTKFKQQTDGILSIDKDKDPETKLTWKAPRLPAWKKHQNTVYWVDINLAQKERIEVLSDTIERNHSS